MTSDNLSTWLSTRYANRNRNKQQEGDKPQVGDRNNTRQARKKSSSGRCCSNIQDEEIKEWLTPKRAKMMESNLRESYASRKMDEDDHRDDQGIFASLITKEPEGVELGVIK